MAIPSPGYWHVSSVGWTAVPAWAALTAYTVGQMVRQLAGVAVGAERVFICIVAGTSLAAEPTWVTTKGAATVEAGGPTWQECTGQPFGNGNLRDTYAWSAVASQAVALGYVIKNNAATHYFTCTTAGTAGGSQPAFNTTTGATTADNTITWTCLGPVGNFTTAFGNPSATLEFVFLATWGAAGDQFYLADNHAQTRSTALTLTSPGAIATPCSIDSVDRTKVSPSGADVLAGATITTTGNNALTLAGAYYFNGVTFNCGSGAVAAVLQVGGTYAELENCQLNKLGTTGSNTAISLAASQYLLKNTTVSFGATTDSIRIPGSTGAWVNTPNAVQGATLPTTLFTPQGLGVINLDGVDLSALAAGKTIFAAYGVGGRAALARCKLGASVTLAATPTVVGATIDAVQCDSAAASTRQQRIHYTGSLQQETTIVRTGGASDGTTPLSWKLVSTANSKWVLPFESFPIAIWNDTVGSPVTATICGIWGGGAVPNNDDIWAEIEYLGSTLTPQASFANDTKANNLATDAPLPSDSSTWGGSTTPFKMTVTFTPQMKGYIYARIYVALPGTTFYVDPLVTLT